MHIKKTMLFVLALMMIVNIAQGMNLTAKPGKECTVCFEEDNCYVSTCHPTDKDIMCLECRKNTIALHLDDKKVPHCPVNGCTHVIDQRTIQGILKNDWALLNRYNSFLEEKQKHENGIKPCPTPNCNGEFNSRSGQRSYQCHSCWQRYCTVCEYDHKGMTCENAAAAERRCPDCDKMHARNMPCDAAAQDEIKNDEAALRDKNFQKCPQCKVLVEKTAGCNYMTCGQYTNYGCGHTFCWICLGPSVNHRCLNNNCGIWVADHATRAAQRDVLYKLTLIATGAASVAFVGYSTVYQTWSQKRKLSLLAQAADQAVEKLLAIEFELFDEGNSLITLQEQFDIASILKIIKSDEKREALKSAIEAYDVSLKAVHDTISSAKYYHQTPEYFAKNEPKLTQNLYADLDRLKQVLSSCQSDICLSWKKLIGMSGLFACAAIGAKHYYFDI